MNKKRILFNLNTFPLVGNIVPLINKMHYWQKMGYSVTIFATPELIKNIKDSNILSVFQSIKIESRSESTNKIKFMLECLRRNIVSLKYLKKIEKAQFSVVYTISSVLDLAVLPFILKYRKNEFFWLTVFDNTVPFTGTGNKIVRFLNWSFFIISVRLIKKADRVFAPSINVQSYLKKKGFCSEQIVPTGNGVEVEMIKNAKKVNDINIDALFIGRINEAKGIYELLEVLYLVKKRFPNFCLAILGEGEARTVQVFHKKIAEMNLSKNVLFLGYKLGQEKYDIIKSSKSFWFFSESEGFPLSLMEAVSSGLKCFVYYLPAYEYYKNNELMIFDQKDHTTVAKAVIDLFRKNDFYNGAGAALLKEFSWERIAEKELNSITQ